MRRAELYLPSEAQVQDAIVRGLRTLGYTVLQLGRWRRQTKCPVCGAWHTPRGGWGNETGTPDLLVGHPAWGNRWLALEVKAPGARSLVGVVPPGRVRPEQAALVRAGLSTIVHSWEEAFAVVQEVKT